jgi:phage tail-like protein
VLSVDANGTRFKALLGKADWGRCSTAGTPLSTLWLTPSEAGRGTRWDERRHELTLAAMPWTFPEPAGQPRLRQSDRRGAAIDRYGNWYWIDGDESGIRVLSSGSNLATPFWPDPSRSEAQAILASDAFGALKAPAKAAPGGLRGLAVTDDHYLLVGTLRPGGLLVFDLRTGGPPLQVAWPADVPFAPLDITPRPGGGAFVLDEGAGGGPRVWRLDRHFMIEPLRQAPPVAPAPPTFSPADGSSRPAPAEPAHPLTLSDAAPLLGDPVAIGLAGDILIVLDRAPGEAGSVIRLFTAGLEELVDSPRELLGFGRPLVVHDIAVAPTLDRGLGEPRGQLYIVDEQGDQAYRFPIQPTGGPLTVAPEYFPMRLFGGRGLIATPTGAAYDVADRWIRLVSQRRARFAELATIETEVLDSGEHGCVWHRLLLDGCLTAEATVRVWSAAADDRAALETAPDWRPEPSPYRRAAGPERPYLPAPADAAHGTYELLFQTARGRYLRLRLELAGNRQTSPSIRSLRVYYPRFSYLQHYLPGVYRAEPSSAAFLDSFLANFEGTYTEIEDRIAAAQVLFDPRTAPPDALDWLAGWFDVVADAGWDEDRRRLLIGHAMDLFRWRGTERGIRLALGLALLACPDDRLFALDAEEPGGIRIVERYQTKRGPAAVFGDPIAQSLPRPASGAPRWAPGDGTAALHERYGAYLDDLASRGLIAAPSSSERKFPLAAQSGDRRAAWRAFAGQVLGFVPSATAADQPRWATFLRHRYRTVGALNAAHNRIGSQALATFDNASLPATLPADGAALADWFAFESVVLRGADAAHQFRVMLPVPIGRAAPGSIVRASDARDRLVEQTRVARLVELEKPAHTTFDVLSFWLAFRVGEARLGRDTLLDLGSRSPDLRPPAVLGSMHVGESVLTSAMADLPDRPAVFSGSVDAATRHVGRRTDG